jgi:hypothetical protein
MHAQEEQIANLKVGWVKLPFSTHTQTRSGVLAKTTQQARPQPQHQTAKENHHAQVR